MEWNFKRVENYYEIPAGSYRCRIADAELAKSKAGNDMIILKLDISGKKSQIWHYIVFMDNNPEITNRKLTEVFDSFDIADGDFNINGWKGKTGACYVKLDEEDRPKVSFFIKKSKQDTLPPWDEVELYRSATEIQVSDDDLPF